MPAPIMSREEVLERIIEEFRRWGYEGATLSKLSHATGLVKASLYHYFPKGKPDMARAVLTALSTRLGEQVLEPLMAQGDPILRLQAMTENLYHFYSDGHSSCALEIFSLGTAYELFHEEIRGAFSVLRDAITRTLGETGMDLATALRQAEQVISVVQGSLVMSRAMDDTDIFRNALKGLSGQFGELKDSSESHDQSTHAI